MDPGDPPRSVECARCGIKSTLPELFLHGSVDQQRTGLLCPKCFAERRAAYNMWYVQAMFVTAAIGGLLWARGLEQVGLVMASFACGFFLTVLLTPLHELAHAVTARALGMTVHSIVIGWFGTRLFSFQVGRCLIEVMRVPLGGLTYFSDRGSHFIRFRQILVVAAGPLLHVVLLVASWLIVVRAERLGDWSGWVAWLGIVFGLANVFEIALNLWPRRFSTPFGEVASDGLTLITLPFVREEDIERWGIGFYYYEYLARTRVGDDAGAIEILQEGLSRYSGEFTLMYCYAAALIGKEDYDKAARVFEALRERTDLSPESDAVLLNNIAWADVASANANKENLPRALDYSRRAIDALPWLPEIRGTRGTVLLASGEIENGMNLLRTAWAENEDVRNRAINAAFLALGSARLGRLPEALDWLRNAQRLDPRCRQIDRVRREVDELSSSQAKRAP